jgi:hypothetical protein
MVGEVAKGVLSGALVHSDQQLASKDMLDQNKPALMVGPPESKNDFCVCHHVVVGFKEKLSSEEQEVNAGHHMDHFAAIRADIGIGV